MSCKCDELKKPLADREWEVKPYYPDKYWGPNVEKYDGRALLFVTCLKCGEFWRRRRIDDCIWQLLPVHNFSVNLGGPYVLSELKKGKILYEKE